MCWKTWRMWKHSLGSRADCDVVSLAHGTISFGIFVALILWFIYLFWLQFASFSNLSQTYFGIPVDIYV